MSIPSRSVGHVSKSLHAIKDKTGAHIEFERTDKKSGGERTIVIR